MDERITVIAYDATLTGSVDDAGITYSAGEATGLDATEAAQHLEHWYETTPDQTARLINMVNACSAIAALATLTPAGQVHGLGAD